MAFDRTERARSVIGVRYVLDMAESREVRNLRIYVDIASGRLQWSEYFGDLAGELRKSGVYASERTLEELYAEALADPSIAVDESEWWDGDCIALSGLKSHSLVSAYRAC